VLRLMKAAALSLMVGFSAAGASAAGLRAGAAKVDITPPTGLPMWGYFDRKTPSQGTLDPLYARVLVLEAGDPDQSGQVVRLALVALDLGRTFGPPEIAQLRERAKSASGISYVLVAASHTHAGPVILDEYEPGKTPAWESADLEKIANAIKEAATHLVSARLGSGYGETTIGYNRRRVNPDGTVTMFWRNPTRVPTAPVDSVVSVLRVDTEDGTPLAILVNYACHPVIFGADNLQYSADYPGVMTQTVEKEFDGKPLCIFLQGAPGDINVYDATTPLEQDAVRFRDSTGIQLGREAARVAKTVRTEDSADSSIQFVEDTMTFHLRWDHEKLRGALLAAFGPDFLKNYAPHILQEYPLPVATLLINKHIALMTMPGEPFVEFQMNWRDRSPASDAFFLGYANGYYGYFPTIQAATEGGYGAASSTTWIEVGAGEKMVNHALVRLYELMGRLTDMPEDLKKK
jgi:neutral/alkaline ceramidase-like enzyme